MPTEINFQFIKKTTSQNVIDCFESRFLLSQEKELFQKMVKGVTIL